MSECIPCPCGQEYPPSRENCPYCGHSAPRIWFLHRGSVQSAAVLKHDGKTQVFYDEKLYDNRDGLPAQLHHLFPAMTVWQKFRAFMGRFKVGFYRVTGFYPRSWDEWVNGSDRVSPFKGVRKD